MLMASAVPRQLAVKEGILGSSLEGTVRVHGDQVIPSITGGLPHSGGNAILDRKILFDGDSRDDAHLTTRSSWGTNRRTGSLTVAPLENGGRFRE